MGGQSARLLVQLLEAGSPEERAASPDDLSPLFAGAHQWVLGLVTFCAPHDGSSLTLVLDYSSDQMKGIICTAMATASAFIDLRLDQWGLARGAEESTGDYAARLRADLSWYLGEDGCYSDLRPSGAARLNAWVKAWPEVYYFSWAASTTYEYGPRQLSSWTTQALLAANALAMGSYSGQDGPYAIGDDWRENDGTVNTISMDGPKLDSSDRILPFDGEALRGAWNYMGCLAETDHMDLLGFTTPPWYAPKGFADCLGWYRYNLDILASLGTD
jgi:Predicted acetyltransferases and hydrolases with the alpha/beta hydrolase fold